VALTHNHSAGSVRCAKQGTNKTEVGRLVMYLKQKYEVKLQLISSLVLTRICSVPLVHLPPDFDVFKPENVRDGACVPDQEKL